MTALHHAAYRGCVPIIEELLQNTRPASSRACSVNPSHTKCVGGVRRLGREEGGGGGAAGRGKGRGRKGRRRKGGVGRGKEGEREGEKQAEEEAEAGRDTTTLTGVAAGHVL